MGYQPCLALIQRKMRDIKQWCKKETLVNKMKVLKSLFLIIYRLMADTIEATGVTGNEVVDVNT